LWKLFEDGWRGLVAALALLPQIGVASTPSIPAEWVNCFQDAGRYYRIAPQLLSAIAEQESAFDPHAVHRNPDGSWDLGLMQINARWLPVLRTAGISPERLYDPCTSIWLGAWILAQTVARKGYTWESVGAYNAGERQDAGSERRRAVYARRVDRHLGRLRAGQRLLDRPARVGIADIAIASPSGTDAGRSIDQR
jgi:soluble lytic murein transglycosylase-like protein